MSENAGIHLIVDGYVSDPAVFTRETVENMFAAVISALEMKALGPAHIYEVPVDLAVLQRVKETGTFEDSGGITGVVVISTSHLSIHCWPAESFFSLDAFSCKDFPHERALSIIRKMLGVQSANVTVLSRRKPVTA
jgi:S-adenosylmethionine/arginine decarboxylase-like enzyme